MKKRSAMSNDVYRPSLASVFGSVIFWSFIAIKVWGTTLAAWSWWWGFLPIVPLIGEYLVKGYHL
jgi:hypothetical protein